MGCIVLESIKLQKSHLFVLVYLDLKAIYSNLTFSFNFIVLKKNQEIFGVFYIWQLLTPK